MKLDESAIDPRVAAGVGGTEAHSSADRRGAGLFSTFKPGIVIAASMDTKGEHVDFLRAELERRGADVIVVDCGIRPAGEHRIEVDAGEIARFAGSDIDTIRSRTERAPALERMLAGLEICIRHLFEAGLVRGFVGLGGGTNASFAARAFRALPYGVPKALVSTAVSGDTKPFIEGTDALLVHPVVDFIGLNAPLRASLSRTAAAMVAMIDIPFWSSAETGRVVGVTSSGATTAAAEAADAYFRGKNLVTYMFHARGPGGIAYEDLIAQGRVAAALDLTTTEIADEVVGGMRSAGPTRLEAATAAGIPQVVVPGGIDLINFSGPETVPARFAHRQLVSHTPSSTLMRTLPEESEAIGAWIGGKLSVAAGHVSVFVPTKGFSSYDREGAPFHDPKATAGFLSGLRRGLAGRPDIRVEMRDQHINDPAFVLGACERLWDDIGVRT